MTKKIDITGANLLGDGVNILYRISFVEDTRFSSSDGVFIPNADIQQFLDGINALAMVKIAEKEGMV